MFLLDALKKRANAPQGYREILRVGLPLVAGMASSTVMQFTDRLFLSRYSVNAIAAALPASIASMTFVMTLMGVCGYTSVLIAQYIGSNAPKRVGSALWQGIWTTCIASVFLCLLWFPAEWLFALAGHDPSLQPLEVIYFRILSVGAGIATVIGWIICVVIMAACIFTPANNKLYALREGMRFEWDMFKRLLRYGLPSGVNFFMELIAVAWFSFEVGYFGKVALAASNIAFSLNSLVFLPMIGLNISLASLVGQAMGRGKVDEAERVTTNTLHIAFFYMLPLALFIAVGAGFLMDIFAPGDLTVEEFAPVRRLGIIFLYFIAVYSLVDAGNIVYFGALKGAGDTLGVMYLLLGSLVFMLIIPICLLKYFDMASPITYWIAFTAYIMILACAGAVRFYGRKWHKIRVVETAQK